MTGYQRRLDLARGVAEASFDTGLQHHRREVLVSHPDEVVAARFRRSGGGGLTFRLELVRHAAEIRAVDDRTLSLVGRAGGTGTRFAGRLRVLTSGGSVESLGSRLLVRDADEAVVLVACETDHFESFRGRGVAEPFERRVETRLEEAAALGFDTLAERHAADHGSLYDRAALTLGAALPDARTTHELRATAEPGPAAPAMFALQFHFARHLLIASARAGGLPPNLQGIWSDCLTPAWNSDFHTNINVQMNHWVAEVANLGELHRPLLDWLRSASTSGERTAATHYGCRGWTMHHLSDPWGFTAPGDAAECGLWPMGGAWCALHAWEHFLHGRDEVFLRDVGYPLMRGAARFLLDFLQPTASGELVTGPSSSPENRYVLSNGETGTLCMGPTMDHQILRELFGACTQAAAVLGVDEALVAEFASALARVPLTRVGPHGTIAEWHDDPEEAEPGHRHLSPLFGLYPGTQIDPRRTPKLAEAARRTIERRRAHATDDAEAGWSYAWKACFHARLGDGDAAMEALNALVRHCTQPNLLGVAHGVTQVDAPLGAAAAIAEMLLQSHGGRVTLLPALPSAWPEGNFRGLVARGGIEVDAAWSAGRLTGVTLRSERAATVELATGTGQVLGSRNQPLTLKPGVPLTIDRWDDSERTA